MQKLTFKGHLSKSELKVLEEWKALDSQLDEEVLATIIWNSRGREETIQIPDVEESFKRFAALNNIEIEEKS